MIRSRPCLCLAMQLLSVFAGCPSTPDQSSPESNISRKETITSSIGMKLVLMPKGTFTMGSPIEEKDRNEDEQSHQVTISQDCYLGAMEVTQGQYEKVMGTNHSYFQGRSVKRDSSNHPFRTLPGRMQWSVASVCQSFLTRRQKVAFIDCRPKRSGNMRVALAVRPRMVLERVRSG
jgi:formylglycine-generating enzyme required for sulfatase activity